jgi:signal transduction histidine kinase
MIDSAFSRKRNQTRAVPLIEGGKIRVEIRKNVDTLYFTVSDTGVGVADKTTLLVQVSD